MQTYSGYPTKSLSMYSPPAIRHHNQNYSQKDHFRTPQQTKHIPYQSLYDDKHKEDLDKYLQTKETPMQSDYLTIEQPTQGTPKDSTEDILDDSHLDQIYSDQVATSGPSRTSQRRQYIYQNQNFDRSYLDRLSSNSSRRARSLEKKVRKIRTTITRQRIHKMNSIFENYYKQKQEGKHPIQTLKQIGKKLGLGYSTVLHKYREYRSNSKVKGGALIVSLQKKRKYRKSLRVESIIEQSLSLKSFYTAIQLCEFIQEHFGQKFSRSIISRHLGDMGYSYKNSKSSPIQKQDPVFCQIRRKYCDIAYKVLNEPNKLIVYIDELVLSTASFSRRQSSHISHQIPDSYVSLIVAITHQGIVHYGIKRGFYGKEEFAQFLDQTTQKIVKFNYEDKTPPKHSIILVTDTHRIHFDDFDLKPEQKIVQKVVNQYGLQRIYLPPASPHLNPLELFFTHIKGKMIKKKIKQIYQLRNQMQNIIDEQLTESMEVYVKDTLQAVANGRTCVQKALLQKQQEESCSIDGSMTEQQNVGTTPTQSQYSLAD